MGQEKDKIKGLDHEKEKVRTRVIHNMIQYPIVTVSTARLYS